LARDRSSSRRAPPIAASKPYWSRAFERLGLHDPGVFGGAVGEGPDALAHAVRIDVHDQLHARLARGAVAELDHLAELPGGVHVQQRDRRLAGRERLEQQVQQHRGILADGIQQHGIAAGGGHFAKDVDALGFEAVEGGEGGHRGSGERWIRWSENRKDAAREKFSERYHRSLGSRGKGEFAAKSRGGRRKPPHPYPLPRP